MYDDPDIEGGDETNKQTCYIEAITGAKFEVKVTLDSSFVWDRCAAVRVSAVYDGAEPGWSHDIRRDSLPTSRTSRHQCKFATITRWCQSSQQWKSGFLSFGALETSKRP